jgi:hypothetical protein
MNSTSRLLWALKSIGFMLLNYLRSIRHVQTATQAGAHPRGGGCRAAAPPPPNTKKPKFKTTHFIDIMISKALLDLPFNRNNPLKSADEQYIRILKKN